MKIVILGVLLLCGLNMIVGGQNTEVLSPRDNRKIDRAEKKIKKGDAIVAKTEKYTREIEEIEAEGKKRKGKIRRLNKKTNKILVGSSSYYKEGYGKKYYVFKRVVSKGLKAGSFDANIETFLADAKDEFRGGRKLRRKSINYSNANKAAPLLLEANEKEGKAIEILAKATGYIHSVDTEEENAVVPIEDSMVVTSDTLLILAGSSAGIVSDSLLLDSIGSHSLSLSDTLSRVDSIAFQDTSLIMTTDTALVMASAVAAESTLVDGENELLEDKVVQEKVPGLYFTVQFLAEEQPVPKEKLLSLYDGPFEVIKHEVDGLVKYSFGKFTSIEEANTMKDRSGVQGFVVAYLNEMRISMSRAEEMSAN